MKKQKTFYLALIIIASIVLFASCTTKNNTVDNNLADDIENSVNAPGKESDNLVNNEENFVSDDEVSTQIGELTIITPKGQEPIQNEDGTITLPDGGTYNHKGDKITVSSGTIINNDGSVSISIDDNLNVNSTIIHESPNGRIIAMTKHGFQLLSDNTSSDVISSDNTSEKENNDSVSDNKTTTQISENDIWNNDIWDMTGNIIYISNNGQISSNFETVSGFTTNVVSVLSNKKACTIILENGVKINAPINTRVDIKDDIPTIIIGDGDATITYTDSTEKTVSKGTVLNNEGNVIE